MWDSGSCCARKLSAFRRFADEKAKDVANLRDVTYVIHQETVIVIMGSKWLLSGIWTLRSCAKIGRVEKFFKQHMKNCLVESTKKL